MVGPERRVDGPLRLNRPSLSAAVRSHEARRSGQQEEARKVLMVFLLPFAPLGCETL